jgi:hypothetical protein
MPRGTVVLRQGDLVDRLYVLKMGEVALSADGVPASDAAFLREAGGFSFFGHSCVEVGWRSQGSGRGRGLPSTRNAHRASATARVTALPDAWRLQITNDAVVPFL